jgi:hypothetical protein
MITGSGDYLPIEGITLQTSRRYKIIVNVRHEKSKDYIAGQSVPLVKRGKT